MITAFSKKIKGAIISKMLAENAANISDGEIDRCLSDCVAAWLPKVAKQYRDAGYILPNEVLTLEQVFKRLMK